jgi:hypothetical protein
MQVRRAARRPQRRPRREGVARGAYGAIDLGLAGPRDLREHLAVDWRDVLEALPARDPLAADVVVGRDVNADDVDEIADRRHVSSFTVSRSSTV